MGFVFPSLLSFNMVMQLSVGIKLHEICICLPDSAGGRTAVADASMFLCYGAMATNDKVVLISLCVETAHFMQVRYRVPAPSSMFMKRLLCARH